MATTDTRLTANKALVRAIPERIMTDGDTDRIYEVFAEDFVEHNPALGEVIGPDGFREYVYDPFHAAFPDVTAEVNDAVAEGDYVVLRVTLSGTHEGEFMGVEPTGKRMSATAFALHRVEDGKVAERWTMFDVPGIMHQLGAMPAP